KEPPLFSPMHSGRGSGLGEQIALSPTSTQNSLISVQSRDWGLGIGVLPTVSHVWRVLPSQWPVPGKQLWSPHPAALTTRVGTKIRAIRAIIISPMTRKTRRSVYTRTVVEFCVAVQER